MSRTEIQLSLLSPTSDSDWANLIKKQNFQVPVVVWDGNDPSPQVRLLAAYAKGKDAAFGVWGLNGPGQDAVVFFEHCRLASPGEIQMELCGGHVA